MPWTGLRRLVSWHIDSTVLIFESSRLWLKKKHRNKRRIMGRIQVFLLLTLFLFYFKSGSRKEEQEMRVYSHDRENLWKDDASFGQVLVQNPLVKVVSSVFDLCGLEKKKVH